MEKDAQTPEKRFSQQFLKYFACLFDFDKHTLTLYYPGNFSASQLQQLGYTGSATTPIALSHYSNDPDASDYDRFVVSVELANGKAHDQTKLTLDTGSDTTVLSKSLAQSLHLKGLSKQHVASPMGDYWGEPAQVSSLSLGTVTLPNVTLTYPVSGDFPPVLGMDVLSHYRVLMDFPAGKMYLAPASPVPGAATPAMPSPDAASLGTSSAGKATPQATK